MKYEKQEVMQYVSEEDVKFIRLAFCDVFGKQKNISIMPGELERAFTYGISIDASAINGFGGDVRSDLFLHPDPDTLTVLPWRPEHGKVVRMFCTVTYPDGRIFENDPRSILREAVKKADEAGYTFYFGPETEFYLFRPDESENPAKIPYDNAGYMDIAPDDKGENVRREICLTLEQMGIRPESSQHKAGPGQNEIAFRYSDAVTAADNAMAFSTVVKVVAARNGLCADFSPKPLEGKPGNGMHINMSVVGKDKSRPLTEMIAGILEKAAEMTVFFNPCQESYLRLGRDKAPKYITYSYENRSQLIRIPSACAACAGSERAELRSPDPSANPYIVFALLIYAGLYGIENKLPLPEAAELNLYTAAEKTLKQYKKLPQSLSEAAAIAQKSEFISRHLPETLVASYCKG